LIRASETSSNASSISAHDSLYNKLAWRILPILFVCYIAAYLDRVNVGFAKLQMMGALNFSDAVYGLGAGIFFLGYFLFEVPSNIILHRFGARVWISRVLITWGICSGVTALVRTPWEFYTIRFLLGVAEAGFFPGMILYLTYWFPSQRRAKMVAFLMAGIPVSGVIGGPLSGWILEHLGRSHGLAGWQWLFILEAMPAIVLGVVILFCLEDRVVNAHWLSPAERALVVADISEEADVKTHHTMLSVFASGRVWLLGAIWFGIEMGSYAIGFWQPTIIRQTGVKNAFDIGLLVMLPYTLALISMIFVGRHSDRVRERRWHIVIPIVMAALGFVLCTRAGSSTIIAMGGLILAVVGVITALPMFWSLPTSFLGGNAAAVGIALINCTGNLGGFFSPTIIGFLKTHTGTLNSGLYLMSGCMLASATLIVTFIPARVVNR
jgi:D-galactonate transporter